MPFMYGLMSCFVGGMLGLLAGFVFFLATFSFFLFLRRKSGQRAILYSLILTPLVMMPVFCISSYLLLDWSLSGPPSPTGKPDNQDIIGVWEMSEVSLESVREAGYQPSAPRLEFREDGTFAMTDIPDIVMNSWEPQNRYYSGTGTWAIRRDIVNDEWDVEIRVTGFTGAQLRGAIPFELYGQTPPYKIYRWAGDPDSGRMWVFERR
jgi:hypothetical protein